MTCLDSTAPDTDVHVRVSAVQLPPRTRNIPSLPRSRLACGVLTILIRPTPELAIGRVAIGYCRHRAVVRDRDRVSLGTDMDLLAKYVLTRARLQNSRGGKLALLPARVYLAASGAFTSPARALHGDVEVPPGVFIAPVVNPHLASIDDERNGVARLAYDRQPHETHPVFLRGIRRASGRMLCANRLLLTRASALHRSSNVNHAIH